MFDFKKTILLTLVVMAVTMTAIAGYCVGRKVGYMEGYANKSNSMNALVLKQDSLMRVQTETAHRLMDRLYTDKTE